MSVLTNSDTIIDVLILLIPLLVVLYLLVKFVVPKKPLLGIGLALGSGLLGAFLIRRRLNKAFGAEEEIARHNKMIAEFKEKQKQRSQVVTANNEVIKNLEKQSKKLTQKGKKFETKRQLLDKEIEERKTLNKKILSDSQEFLNSLKEKDAGRRDLLRELEAGQGMQEDFAKDAADNNGVIEVDGYRLNKL